MKNKRAFWIKLVVDLIIMATLAVPIFIFHVYGKPVERGFFCDDDSIRYPFKNSTVKSFLLNAVGIFLPVLTISLNEFHEDLKRRRKQPEQKPLVLLGIAIPNYCCCWYQKIGIFFFGACLSHLTTDIAKHSIGRLRPHFLDVCKPNISCFESHIDPHRYIEPTEFVCTDSDTARIKEARLSFPSAHAAFSAYTMVYLALYLHGCMKTRPAKLLRPFLQFIVIMMAWGTALSRVSDFKHHWSDVMIGFLQGAFVAIIVAIFISDIFKKPPKQEDDDQASHSTVGVAQASNDNTIDLEQR